MSTAATPAPRALAALIALTLFGDMFVYGSVVSFLPQLAAARGASGSAVGILVGCYALGLFVCAWPMAWLVPKIGPRAAMLWGAAGLASCSLAFMVGTSYASLVVARTLQGVAAAATWTAGPMLLASSVAPERRGKVMGMALTCSGLGTLCGPPLGGWLFELGGLRWPCVLSFALCTLMLIGVALLVPRRVAKSNALPLARVCRQPQVRLIAMLIVAASSSLTLLEPVLPLHLSEHFGLTPAQIGLAFGIAILGYALSATGVGALADRFGSTLTAAAGLLLMASMLPLFAHANSIAQLGVLLGAFGVSSALALTPTMSAMADAIDGIDPSQRAGTSPPDYAGVYAIYNAAYALGMWLGPVLGASLVQHTGLGAGLGYAALGAGVCAALAVRRVNFPR